MSFDLSIKFGGLCFYVIQPAAEGKDLTHVAILMPDARDVDTDGDGRGDAHADGSVPKPHVGYLSVDPVHLFPTDTTDGAILNQLPAEVVFRFDRSHLHFEPLGTERITLADGETASSLALPDLRRFAPCLRVKHSDLIFSDAVPAEHPLLMRTVITGGTLSGAGSAQWYMPHHFNRSGKPQRGAFAGHIVWTRTIKDATSLTIRITDFQGNPQARLPLRPVNGRISLSIANLCRENPLGWEELAELKPITDDVDFKWFYRLLEPADECVQTTGAASPTFEAMLMGVDLPVPRHSLTATFGGEHCIGLQGSADLPAAVPRGQGAAGSGEVRDASR